MKLPRKSLLNILVLVLLIIFYSPTVYASERAVTYIGNYEVTESEEIKKEVVRVAGGMGKVIKSRERHIRTRNIPQWEYKYITTDSQGSTRQELTAEVIASGTKQSPNTYYAYGTPINPLNAQKQIVEDTYTGQKKDEETGLMYYNARYYNPQTGLFIQADSVDDGQNKYQYVGGNPINNTDPSGNELESPTDEDLNSMQDTLQKSLYMKYLELDSNSELKDPALKELVINFIKSINEDMNEIQILDTLSSYLYNNIKYSSVLIKMWDLESSQAQRPYSYPKHPYYQRFFQEEEGEELKQFETNWRNYESKQYGTRLGNKLYNQTYSQSLGKSFVDGLFICGNFAALATVVSNDLLDIDASTIAVTFRGRSGAHAIVGYNINNTLYISDPTWNRPLINIRKEYYHDRPYIDWESAYDFRENSSFNKYEHGISFSFIKNEIYQTSLNKPSRGNSGPVLME